MLITPGSQVRALLGPFLSVALFHLESSIAFGLTSILFRLSLGFGVWATFDSEELLPGQLQGCGDVGFATGAGGVIEDMDLDNGDTADMFESAFGFASFANKGPWTIRLSYATLTLEDDNSNFDAEWDKAQGELSVEYTFANTGSHRFGVIGGVSYTDHEWEPKNHQTQAL